MSYQPKLGELAELFFVVLKPNAEFANGDVSLLLAVSEDAADLAPKVNKGALVTHTIRRALFDKGFCPGAAGSVQGVIEASTSSLRDDGSAWLRLRKPAGAKFVISRKGNTATGEADVEFNETT